MNIETKNIFTIKELAEQERVSRTTIYRRLKEETGELLFGKYRAYKIGPTHWRFEAVGELQAA